MNQPGWKFEHSYQSLPTDLFQYAQPRKYSAPKCVLINESLAQSLDLDFNALMSPDEVASLAGNGLPDGSSPIAQAYAGHQFGNFTILGDGRAILLGEHRLSNGKTVDIQLKGSGPTPYSRRGDGLATLGALLKEYIYSEAMHGLGIPTTRSLALIETGDSVHRQQLHPGAVMTRVASSHIRVGTFEFAAQNDISVLKSLADYTIKRHYPELLGIENPYLAFLEQFIDRQAYLVALWMSVGFVHGVMNTDNVSIAGETIDYGPCAFIDEYDLRASFSSIDRQGRYAYGNQPKVLHWNICRFAESLLPLIYPDEPELAIQAAQDVLKKYPARYEAYWQELFCKKIGFSHAEPKAVQLVQDLLQLMAEQGMDFTGTFSQLTSGSLNEPRLNEWLNAWQSELLASHHDLKESHQIMSQANPVVTLRNHVLVSAIDDAEFSGNMAPFLDLLNTIKNPYSEAHRNHTLAAPRPTGMRPTVTYCGT